MNFTTTGGLVTRQLHLRLSERNLRALLAKLTLPESLCTLVMEDGALQVAVTAEPDGQHYDGRVPGAMTPETEDAMMAEIHAHALALGGGGVSWLVDAMMAEIHAHASALGVAA